MKQLSTISIVVLSLLLGLLGGPIHRAEAVAYTPVPSGAQSTLVVLLNPATHTSLTIPGPVTVTNQFIITCTSSTTAFSGFTASISNVAANELIVKGCAFEGGSTLDFSSVTTTEKLTFDKVSFSGSGTTLTVQSSTFNTGLVVKDGTFADSSAAVFTGNNINGEMFLRQDFTGSSTLAATGNTIVPSDPTSTTLGGGVAYSTNGVVQAGCVHTWTGNTISGANEFEAVDIGNGAFDTGSHLIFDGNTLSCPITRTPEACKAFEAHGLQRLTFKANNKIQDGGFAIGFTGSDSATTPNEVSIHNSVIRDIAHVTVHAPAGSSTPTTLAYTKIDIAYNQLLLAPLRIASWNDDNVHGPSNFGLRGVLSGPYTAVNVFDNYFEEGCFRMNNITMERINVTARYNTMTLPDYTCQGGIGFNRQATFTDGFIVNEHNVLTGNTTPGLHYGNSSISSDSTMVIRNNSLTTSWGNISCLRMFTESRILITDDNRFNGSVVIEFTEDNDGGVDGSSFHEISVHHSALKKFRVRYRGVVLNHTKIDLRHNTFSQRIIFQGNFTGTLGYGSTFDFINNTGTGNLRLMSNFDSVDANIIGNTFESTPDIHAGLVFGRGNFSRGTLLLESNSLSGASRTAVTMGPWNSSFVDGGHLILRGNTMSKLDADTRGGVMRVKIGEGGRLTVDEDNVLNGDAQIRFTGKSSGHSVKFIGHAANSVSHINITMGGLDQDEYGEDHPLVAEVTDSLIQIKDCTLSGGIRLTGNGTWGTGSVIEIVDNTLSGSEDHRLLVNSDFLGDSSVTISGNTFDSTSMHEFYHALIYGVRAILGDSTVHTISGNTFTSAHRNGLWLASSMRDNALLHITDNSFSGSSLAAEFYPNFASVPAARNRQSTTLSFDPSGALAAPNGARILFESNTVSQSILISEDLVNIPTQVIGGGSLEFKSNTFNFPLAVIGLSSATAGFDLFFNGNTFAGSSDDNTAPLSFLGSVFSGANVLLYNNVFASWAASAVSFDGNSQVTNGGRHVFFNNSFLTSSTPSTSTGVVYNALSSCTSQGGVILQSNTFSVPEGSNAFGFNPGSVDSSCLLSMDDNRVESGDVKIAAGAALTIGITNNVFSTVFSVDVTASDLDRSATNRVFGCNTLLDESPLQITAPGFTDNKACDVKWTKTLTIRSPLSVSVTALPNPATNPEMRVQVSCLKDVALDVKLIAFVETGGVSILTTTLLPSETRCKTSFPGLECDLGSVSADSSSPETLDFTFTIPSYFEGSYTFKGSAEGLNTDGAATFSYALGAGASNGTFAPGSQLTSSPPSTALQGTEAPAATAAAAAVVLGIFGASSDALRCTDPIVFSWIIFGLSLVGALLAAYLLIKKDESQEVNTWLDIPLWRSLALQHTWIALFIPCHSACCFNHLFIHGSHFFTIMMFAALCTFLFNNVNTDITVALLAPLIAQGFRPISQFYYWVFVAKNISATQLMRLASVSGKGTFHKSSSQVILHDILDDNGEEFGTEMEDNEYTCLNGRKLVKKLQSTFSHRDAGNQPSMRRPSNVALVRRKSVSALETLGNLELEQNEHGTQAPKHFDDDVVLETGGPDGFALTGDTVKTSSSFATPSGQTQQSMDRFNLTGASSRSGTQSDMRKEKTLADLRGVEQDFQLKASASRISGFNLSVAGSDDSRPMKTNSEFGSTNASKASDSAAARAGLFSPASTNASSVASDRRAIAIKASSDMEWDPESTAGSTTASKSFQTPQMNRTQEKEEVFGGSAGQQFQDAAGAELQSQGSDDDDAYNVDKHGPAQGKLTVGDEDGTGAMATGGDFVDIEEVDALRSITTKVEMYRKRGHIFSVLFLAVTSIITYISALQFSNQQCNTFTTSLWKAILVDFFLMQPVGIALVVIYRWVSAEDLDEEDEHNQQQQQEEEGGARPQSAGLKKSLKKLSSFLHPIDGEIRLRTADAEPADDEEDDAADFSMTRSRSVLGMTTIIGAAPMNNDDTTPPTAAPRSGGDDLDLSVSVGEDELVPTHQQDNKPTTDPSEKYQPTLAPSATGTDFE